MWHVKVKAQYPCLQYVFTLFHQIVTYMDTYMQIIFVMYFVIYVSFRTMEKLIEFSAMIELFSVFGL